MTLYFYTVHRSACGKIAKTLENKGHSCSIYTNLDNFYKAVSNMKTYPDLLLLDHSGYDCSIFQHLPLYARHPLPHSTHRLQRTVSVQLRFAR